MVVEDIITCVQHRSCFIQCTQSRKQ